MKKPRIPTELQVWIDARKRFRLSHAHVQMARELGMNPKKLGKLDNHRQEAWKAPLPEFIEHCYNKRFGRVRPERVLSIEQRAVETAAKKAARKAKRAASKEPIQELAEATHVTTTPISRILTQQPNTPAPPQKPPEPGHSHELSSKPFP